MRNKTGIWTFFLTLAVTFSPMTSWADDFAVDEEWDDFQETVLIDDPYVKYNQWMFDVNDKIYRYVFNPISNGYNFVVHDRIQEGFDNIFTNAKMPIRFFNNLFQKKYSGASTEAGRFLINSSIGIGGLFDPAEAWFDLQEHNEDFGQTLGHYGYGPGPYIVLPLLGPSSGRDVIGFIGDRALSPWTWIGAFDVSPSEVFDHLPYLRRTNAYSYKQRDNYEQAVEDAIDPYSSLQDYYVQYRKQQIEE